MFLIFFMLCFFDIFYVVSYLYFAHTLFKCISFSPFILINLNPLFIILFFNFSFFIFNFLNTIIIQVKNIRGLHFCDIVSVEHLQCRLAEDCSKQAICLGMTELLLSSYYPQQTGGEQKRRWFCLYTVEYFMIPGVRIATYYSIGIPTLHFAHAFHCSLCHSLIFKKEEKQMCLFNHVSSPYSS